jgi:ferricrocin synthase
MERNGASIAMSPEELSILNSEPKRLPGPTLLHDLVRRESPSGLPAILSLSCDGFKNAISYDELHGAADALAERIRGALGRFPPDYQLVVPVLVPQSPDLYISLLAILKVGGAFCPLNLDAPPERIKFILNDVSAPVVLVAPELASKIPEQDSSDRAVILVDLESQEPGEHVVDGGKSLGTGELAYVMYTSGSTGIPKGVGVSHSAATQSLLAHDRHIPKFTRFLQFAAPTFDVSVFEIFFPLFRGATLATCGRADMLNDLPGVIRAMDVDACELTPTVAGSLLRSRQNAPGLKLLLTIGEMLTEPVIRAFGGDSERESILWAMYGPTEAAIHW